jgi:hypothetical protein
MTETTIPIDFVRGTEEVTAWLWPNRSDSVTVRLPLRQWAELERTAEEIADGDVERVVAKLLKQDMMSNYL